MSWSGRRLTWGSVLGLLAVLVFSVDTAGTATMPSGPGTPEGLVARWVVLAALAGTLGGITLAAVVRRQLAAGTDPRLADAYRRALTLAARCAAGGALFGLVRLNDERLRETAGLWRLVTGTSWGWRWTGGEAAFVVLLLLALQLRRDSRRRWWAGVTGAALVSGGLTAVLLLAGVLGVTPPPAAQRTAATTTSTASAGDLLATVSATPTGADTVAFDLTVTSSRRPPPAAVDAVTIRVAGRAVALRRVDVERFAGVGLVGAGFAGGPVTVELLRAGELLSVPLQLTVAGPDRGLPLAPLLDLLAVLSGLSGLLLAVAGRRVTPADVALLKEVR